MLSEFDFWNYEKREKALESIPNKFLKPLIIEWAKSLLPIFEKEYLNNQIPRKILDDLDQNVEVDEQMISSLNTVLNLPDILFSSYNSLFHISYIVDLFLDNSVHNFYTASYVAFDVAEVTDNKKWIYQSYINIIKYKDFKKEWKTFNTTNLAKEIKNNANFDIMPILADALQESDCDDEELLSYLRTNQFWSRNHWLLQKLIF